MSLENQFSVLLRVAVLHRFLLYTTAPAANITNLIAHAQWMHMHN